VGLRIDISGAGRFGRCFVRLFRAHSLVDEVSIADAFPKRLAAQAARFGVERTYRMWGAGFGRGGTVAGLARRDVS
jgi:predicted dehydrogenase